MLLGREKESMDLPYGRDNTHTHTYYYVFCHPTMCSMIFNMDHSKLSRKKKTSETKGNPCIIVVAALVSIGFRDDGCQLWSVAAHGKHAQQQRQQRWYMVKGPCVGPKIAKIIKQGRYCRAKYWNVPITGGQS